jgi:MAF protein
MTSISSQGHSDLPLFLASASPRRRQLLAATGAAYELIVAPVDEEVLTAAYGGPLELLGEYLASCKALAARAALRAAGRRGRILTADTTVLLDGASLPKPRDLGEARQMLERLRGREHEVATGVALASTEANDLTSATSSTRVLMREYADDEVAAYVASGDPLDKAGAYSIQHPDFHPVARFTGCHLGVIGLPLCIVAALLGRAGSKPPMGDPTTGGLGLPPAQVDRQCSWSSGCTRPFPAPAVVHYARRQDGEA